MGRQKNEHNWLKISSSQSRCKVCGIVKTSKVINYVNTITYQDNNSITHKEYIPCIEKPDDSEFYK